MRKLLPLNTQFQRVFIGCLMWALFLPLSAQDRHFSDFRMAPTAINPGLTGGFSGTYRLSGIYRDQWRSISSSSPFQTIVGSVEFNIKGDLLLENDWISGGLGFSSDKAGTGGVKQTLTSMNLGYHLGLDDDYKNVVSFGLSFGRLSTVLRGGQTFSTDLAGMTSQPDFSINPGECQFDASCNNQGMSQPGGSDISAGFTFKTAMDDGGLMRFGLAYFHINAPEQTLSLARRTGDLPRDPDNPDIPLFDPDNPLTQGRKADPFPRNFVLFGEGSTLLSPRLRLNPAMLVMIASGTTQIQLQSTADYLIKAEDQISLTGGLGIRPVPNFDAAYLMGGVKIKDLTVRLTYDITLSSLRNTGAPGNSFELAVGYIGRIYKDPNVDKVIFCPRL